MRVLLFDWNKGGHHAEFARAFAAALQPGAEVVLAAPDQTLATLDDTAIETISLGDGRPRPSTVPGDDVKAVLANQELELIESLVRQARPDQLVLLWADPVLRWLLRRPPFPIPVSLYLFFAPLHYPFVYRTPLGPHDLGRALFKEASVLRWMRRADAHALFGFDPVAGRRWQRYPGAPAYVLPEPPLSYVPAPVPGEQKRGALLFGYLDERKGIDRIAAALASGAEGVELRLYGEVAPGYAATLEGEVARMRAAGATVETRFERLPYEEALDAMARARVALLAFGWTPPGSRVLLEAASAGTPVVGSSKGAVGHLIRRHGLGRAVDPGDPGKLGAAIRELSSDPAAPAAFAPNLRRYAETMNRGAARREIRRALGLPADAAAPAHTIPR